MCEMPYKMILNIQPIQDVDGHHHCTLSSVVWEILAHLLWLQTL